MTSFNHYALGAVTQWLLDDVAGLALDSPGGGAWLRRWGTDSPAPRWCAACLMA